MQTGFTTNGPEAPLRHPNRRSRTCRRLCCQGCCCPPAQGISAASIFSHVCSLPLPLTASLCLSASAYQALSSPMTSGWQGPWWPPLHTDLALPGGSVPISTQAQLLIILTFSVFPGSLFGRKKLVGLVHLCKLGNHLGGWPTCELTALGPGTRT